MTLGAVFGQSAVLAVDDKTGFLGMVKLLPIQRSELGITTGVLHVALDAVVGDVAVHALLRRDPFGNRLVAGETAGCIGFLARFVALFAVVNSFVLRVGF